MHAYSVIHAYISLYKPTETIQNNKTETAIYFAILSKNVRNKTRTSTMNTNKEIFEIFLCHVLYCNWFRFSRRCRTAIAKIGEKKEEKCRLCCTKQKCNQKLFREDKKLKFNNNMAIFDGLSKPAFCLLLFLIWYYSSCQVFFYVF